MPGSRTSPRSSFLDVSFNDEGNLLYAWSMGGLHGVLVCWKILSSFEPEYKFASYYESDENQWTYDNNLLRLYPYTHYDISGCVVGASSNKLFFGASRASAFSDQRAAPLINSISSKELRVAEVRACCVGKNGPFITLQRSRKLFQEFQVKMNSLPKGNNYQLGENREASGRIGRRGDPKRGTQIAAFDARGSTVVGIFHLDGGFDSLIL
jgi:hypothetical protein